MKKKTGVIRNRRYDGFTNRPKKTTAIKEHGGMQQRKKSGCVSQAR